MKKKTIEKRNIHKECWNLDVAFFAWLRSRLPIYLKDAGNIVDLDFHKWEYKGNVLTQKQLIQKLISDLELEDKLPEYNPMYNDIVNEILDIWKLIFRSMWW